jgi:NAD(P)-dependent dehydrogenase (short-subunit alcohol dehydrogenase family)
MMAIARNRDVSMDYFDGKIAVITGAASGIGRALALQLNRSGCELFLSDVNEAGLAETLSLRARQDVPATATVLDMADKAGVHAWADQVTASHGHVDVVVNNAGVAYVATVEESDYEHQEWLMGINFWGVVYGTQAFLPLLRKSSQGHLANISSVFGLVGIPTQSAYNASKFAVRGYTEALRLEMAGTNVHVCCVHPGGIKTNIARAARSEDTAVSADQRGRDFEKLARTSPEAAATQILKALEKRKKRLLIGADARYFSIISRLMPVNYSLLLPRPDKPGSTGP